MKPLAQLVLPAIRWDRDRGFASAMADVERALSLGVGGFIVFGGERDAVRRLTKDLQAAAPQPLLLASDLERGAGQQVSGLTPLPPLMALAALGEEPVREAAGITAREAREVGLNWALAPVLDLDVEPANPIVQTRAFGGDPERVAELGAAWVRSCQAEGVLACGKHYPGHGRSVTDSHADLPVISASRAELERDLLPFARAVEAGVAGIMTAHVAYPALDPGGGPATYSATITHALLRERLGFDGLVVTDALIMEGALKGADEASGAVRALGAGCDLLLYPRDVEAVARGVEVAVASGAIAALRVDEALARLDAARRTCVPAPRAAEEAQGRLGRGEQLAREAVRVMRGEPPRAPAAAQVLIVDDDAGGPYPLPPRTAFGDELSRAGVELRPGGQRIVLLFADVKAWKGRAELSVASCQRLAELLAKPATVLLFGHPRRLSQVPGEGPVLCAWSGDVGMQRAAAQRLLFG